MICAALPSVTQQNLGLAQSRRVKPLIIAFANRLRLATYFGKPSCFWITENLWKQVCQWFHSHRFTGARPKRVFKRCRSWIGMSEMGAFHSVFVGLFWIPKSLYVLVLVSRYPYPLLFTGNDSASSWQTCITSVFSALMGASKPGLRRCRYSGYRHGPSLSYCSSSNEQRMGWYLF